MISFSFFGTYNSIVSNPVRDQVVFTAVDGENIRRSDLDEMVMFISTDNHDKQLFGGAWGPNFLNDGVIRKNLLETGLANVLAASYLADLKPDLESRLQKEKAYVPYAHPQAKFISQEFVWSIYAPELSENFKALRNLPNSHSETAFETRSKLFLNEMAFPSYYQHSVLNSQEKQFKSLPHDERLDHSDLSLFGYHTIEDWFGPRFIRLSAQFLINAAKIAEQKGYKVTKEEALADLLRNSQISYGQNINNPKIGVVNSNEYYNEQLRILGMDQNQAIKIWSQVLLFRKMFHDVGNAVFVDPLIYQNFSEFANESIEGDFYNLPKELQFADYSTLQKFESYLDAVTKRSLEEAKSLKLPEKFLTAQEVSRRNPELVQKRYFVKLKEANKNQLGSKVSLKETWNFEANNWDLLKEKFPELGIKKADTREERLAVLDSLDNQTRSRIDFFARKEIVETHPEWLVQALDKSRERTLPIGISKAGNNVIFEGLQNGEDLIKELDKTDISSTVRFSANGQNYYLITVLDKPANEKILTFKEANQAGILDALVDKKLNAHYQKHKEEKNWKSFEDSKISVADDYYGDLLKAIATASDENEKATGNLLAPFRFFSYMKESENLLKKDPASAEKIIAKTEETEENKLASSKPLNDQWKLQKNSRKLSRGQDLNLSELFNLKPNSWTDVLKAPNGDISFFNMKDLSQMDAAAIYEKVKITQNLLSDEAQKHFMKKVVGEIKNDHAISLDYLNQSIETMDPEIPNTSNMMDS